MTDLQDLMARRQAVIDARDVDGLLGMMSADVSMMWLPVGTFNGHVGVREAMDMLYTAFPDFRRTQDSLAITDGTAVVEFTATGTFSGGPFDGYQPTGRTGEVIGAEIVDVGDDGLITSVRTYWDGMQMARELGLLPEEDSVLDRGLHGALNVMTRARRVIRL